MMGREISAGSLVRSLAGHDAGEYFIVARRDGKYLWLCNGKTRKAARLKKKKLKHTEDTGLVSERFFRNPELINNTSVKKEIKELLAKRK